MSKCSRRMKPDNYPNFCTMSFIRRLTTAQQVATNQNMIKNYGQKLQETSTLAGSIIPSTYDELVEKMKKDAKATKDHHNRIVAVMWLYITYLNDLPEKCRKKICKPKLNNDQIKYCIEIVKGNITLLERQKIINKEELCYMKKLKNKLCEML